MSIFKKFEYKGKKGYASSSFFVYKNDQGVWCAIHMESGHSVPMFKRPSAKAVKSIVEEAEKLFNWKGKDVFKIAKNNNVHANEIFFKCEEVAKRYY